MAQLVQTIPIMCKYLTNQSDWNPTDYSLGLALVDLSKYSGVTKVEVWYSCKASQYGAPDSNTCDFRLYDKTNAAVVTDSTTMKTTTAAEVLVSSDITAYCTGKVFYATPQMHASGLQPYFVDCTIVIYQTIADVTNCKTRTIIPIGDVYANSGSYAEVAYPKRWFYDDDDYDGTITAYFMVTGMATSASNLGIAQLYNRTDSAEITHLHLTSATYAEFISADIKASITDDKEYTTRVQGFGGLVTGTICNAFLIIDQTGSLTKFKTQLLNLNSFKLFSQTAYGNNWYEQIIKYPTGWLDCTRVITIEDIFYIGAGGSTAYVHTTDDAVEITGSELSTALTVATRVTSGAVTEPDAESILLPDGKVANAGNEMRCTCSRLIITVTNMANPAAPSALKLLSLLGVGV